MRSVAEVEPARLREAGVEAILLDLDNTLVTWKGTEIPDTTREWVRRCQEAGLKLCLVSNTRNVPRLQRLCEELRVPYVRARMKPSRQGFQKALELLQTTPDRAVMIGDQLFTDIWGANRMGMRSIWVERIHPREFVGTRLSRLVERILLRWLRRAWEEV